MPPINAGLWMHRWAAELGLDGAVARVALRLSRLHFDTGAPQLQLLRGRAAHPWAVLMACLLCTLRFLYGLDGRGDGSGAAARGGAALDAPDAELVQPPPPAEGWQAWAARLLRPRPGLSVGPRSAQEVRLRISGISSATVVAPSPPRATLTQNR
jgi:hypothetical protein